jgi:CheY-like chemotaxis protein
LQNNEKRQPVRILIVEGDESVARICQKALQHERFETRWVTTTEEAWRELECWRPQVYVMGDEFDDCLAIEFCGQLRAKTNAPILVLTSTDSVGFQVNCLEAGADDVLVRPIAPPLLLGKAQSHVRRAYRYSVPPMAPRPKATPQAAPTTPAPAPVPNGVKPHPAPVPAAAPAAASNGTAATAVAPARPAVRLSASPAPVTPEALAPETNFNSWPRCGACGYMGPTERFEGKNEEGFPVRICPACSTVGQIRVQRKSLGY